jgi:hypothetical protein
MTFIDTATFESLRNIEKQFNITLVANSGSLAEFECRNGIADSTLVRLGRLDGVKSVTFTKLGSGQTEINFADRDLKPNLDEAGDVASSAIDIDAEGMRAHGIVAKISFGQPGVYKLQGNIEYGTKRLPLPECRVIVTR